MMKRILCILFIWAAFIPVASSQLLPFRSYSIEKGLSEAVVNDMMQDDDGYLWIATSYGLNRFNGIEFTNYYEEDGLSGNKVFSLYQDNEGKIWIGTDRGLNVIEQDSIRSLPALKPLDISTILEIFQDSEGEYWYATDGQGVWHLDRNSNLTQYTTVHGLAGDRVRDIIEEEDGTIWFGTREGLTSLRNGNFRSYTTNNGLPDNKIRDLHLDDNGTMWIATRGGLSNYIQGSFLNFTEADGLINNRIQSISPDGSGNLWLGTEEGVSHFEDESFINYTVQEGLSNDIIYSTLLDRENNIWFGTLGGGINVFLGDYLKNYTVEEGLPNNVITSITEDRDGFKWITTYGGGISMYNGLEFINYTHRDGLVDDKVYSALFDDQNRLFVGTRWGLSIFNGETFYNFDEDELPYRKIRAIMQPDDRKGYWLATYGQGVLYYVDNEFRHITEVDGLANNTVLSVAQDHDGAIWFATYGGVSKYENGQFTNFSLQDGLPNSGVLDILVDSDGSLWFATFGGVAHYQNGRFNAITSSDGLPDEVCYFIEQDDNGIYWIGTNKGVIRFDYGYYLGNNESEQRNNAFRLITQDQGLIANEMNAGASYKDRGGNLWFGSVGGLIQLDPGRLKLNTASPKVHIEKVRVSGQQIPLNTKIAINGSEHITFEYVGINFSAPEQVVYRYRLRNSGEEWQRTNQRIVRYSALLPGDYVFEVQAQNDEGVWSEKVAQTSFTVLAPFWMQWWFIAIVFLTLFAIMIFIYNYYRVKKMMEMERMRVRIASDLHDDVGSSLTEIALQSDFLQAMEVDTDLKQSLDQIGAQSRKIVSSLDDIVWSIDARNDTLGDLTDRMQDYVNNMLPQKEVHYHFDDINMDEKLTVQMKENLYLIFKEAINNIAKHSDATKVSIKLKNVNGSFDLIIDDNGSGIKSEKRTGHGLRNMKMRAKRIDANIEFNSNGGFSVHVYNERK